MRRTGTLFLTVITAVFFAACGGTAENKPANTANTAKPAPAAPTVDALVEMDKKANDAWFKGDKAFFEGMLSDKFVAMEQGQRMGRAEMLGMIGSFKCDVKSWNLEDPKMSKINDDTYALSYKGTFDGSCTGPDGKSMPLPSPVRAASIYVRDGEKWKGAFHGETPLIEPKTQAGPPKGVDTAKKEEPKKADAKTDAAKAEEAGVETAKREAPKKDDAGKNDVKREDAKTADGKPAASNANAAAPAPAKPTPSANTEALVKTHTAGWEAFKAKDVKWFEVNMASSYAMVDPIGVYVGSKADAIKTWTETMKCEGITKVSVTDGFATALSPTVELLTLKGSSDGTCDGQKNAPLYQTAVYVKEGEAWKLAFMFETPAK